MKSSSFEEFFICFMFLVIGVVFGVTASPYTTTGHDTADKAVAEYKCKVKGGVIGEIDGKSVCVLSKVKP